MFAMAETTDLNARTSAERKGKEDNVSVANIEDSVDDVPSEVRTAFEGSEADGGPRSTRATRMTSGAESSRSFLITACGPERNFIFPLILCLKVVMPTV